MPFNSNSKFIAFTHEIRSIAGGSDVYSCCHNFCDMLASVSHVLCVRLPSGE